MNIPTARFFTGHAKLINANFFNKMNTCNALIQYLGEDKTIIFWRFISLPLLDVRISLNDSMNDCSEKLFINFVFCSSTVQAQLVRKLSM